MTTPHQFKWTRGNLANGFASYAEHLGLQPADAVFINSLVVDPKGATWRMTATDDLEGVSTAYTLAMSGPQSVALHFPLTRAQQQYVSTYLAEGGTLKAIEPVAEGRRYPEASIITALLSTAHTPETQNLLKGKVIVNSYVTEEVEALAEKTGASVLMSNSTFLKFVGKEYLHQTSVEEGFDAPPGVVIEDPKDIFAKAGKFRAMMLKKGIDPETTKVWIKPTSLSGGQGVISKPDATPDSLMEAFGEIAKAYQDCGFFADNTAKIDPQNPFKGIQRFMPIVMEVDVGKLPGVIGKIDDVGVKAIIGDKGVTHVENTVLSTQNGHYMGSRLPQAADERVVTPTEIAADKLMQRMHKDGYRGYISVNAIAVENADGTVSAYMNDINTRLSGASPLLGLAHKAEQHLGQRPHAFSKGCKLPLPEGCTDAFEVVAEHLGKNLYRGAESGYTGIVPAVVDVPTGGNHISYRAVVIAKTEAEMIALNKALTAPKAQPALV